MIALLRLIVFGFLFLSVIYLSLSWYSRSIRREKLEDSWAEEREYQLSDRYITLRNRNQLVFPFHSA